MEFKAKRRKLNIEIEGQKYEVSFPRLKDLHDYQENVQGKKDVDMTKMLGEFLSSLGLPLEAQQELEAPDLKEIVDLLSDQKKV
jgi:hypothetical protein